ncbi:MAG: hypothetical protein SVV03_00005, partial [Candidatus Nanohaloarchaea archaeon]|nr:hypothetical protein [Candidatus Nanohaloarchaea archaeon]
MDEYDGMLDGWRDNAYTFFTSLALFTGGFISPGLDAQEQDVSDRPVYEAESERYKKNAEEDSNKRSIQAVGVDNEDMIEDISFGAPPAAGELDLTLYNEDRLENMKEKVESMKERSRNDELSSKKRETALDALWEAVHRYREIDPYQYFREKFPDRRTKEEELDEYISERLEEVPHKTREYRVYLPSDYSENVTQEKLDSLDLMEKRHIKLYLDAFEKVENRKEIGMLIGKDLHPGNVPVEGLKEDGSEGFFQFTANSSEIIGKVVRGEGLIDFQPAEPRKTIDNNSAFYNLEV